MSAFIAKLEWINHVADIIDEKSQKPTRHFAINDKKILVHLCEWYCLFITGPL
jgi:hypothetical protein